ncbi:hypothetical protein Tco_0671917 [Tanacetum coccineum]
MGCLPRSACFRVRMLDHLTRNIGPRGGKGFWRSENLTKLDRSLLALRPSRLCAQARSEDGMPFHTQACKEYTRWVFFSNDLILPLAHLFVGDKRWERRVRNSLFLHEPLQTGHYKNGFRPRITYDCTGEQPNPWRRRDFRNLQTLTRASLVGRARILLFNPILTNSRLCHENILVLRHLHHVVNFSLTLARVTVLDKLVGASYIDGGPEETGVKDLLAVSNNDGHLVSPLQNAYSNGEQFLDPNQSGVGWCSLFKIASKKQDVPHRIKVEWIICSDNPESSARPRKESAIIEKHGNGLFPKWSYRVGEEVATIGIIIRSEISLAIISFKTKNFLKYSYQSISMTSILFAVMLKCNWPGYLEV